MINNELQVTDYQVIHYLSFIVIDTLFQIQIELYPPVRFPAFFGIVI